MGSREDDDYWNTKYAEASCYEHGEEFMWYDSISGDWVCEADSDSEEYDDTQEANEEAYRYG